MKAKLQSDILTDSGGGIRVLCPTMWAVHASALSSILENYGVLNTWEEAIEINTDTETKARIIGVSAQMNAFPFLYGTVLAEMIFRHTNNLSTTLQHKNTSESEGQEVARMVV